MNRYEARQHSAWAIFAALVLTLVWGFTIGYMAATPIAPHCPTEDSCRADYDGASHTWSIIEVTP
jgi:hypothetical protein